MQKLLNKKLLITLAVIVLVFFTFSFLYKPISPLPRIIASSPTTGSTNVSYFEPIQLSFDQTIDPTLVKIESDPPDDWLIKPVDSKTLSIKSRQYLRVATQYSLSVFYDDSSIATIDFKTIAQQSDPRYTQSVVEKMAIDYPLATRIPYETSNYRVVYSAPLTLEITILNPNLTSAEVIEEVKTWVTSQGGDATKHQYVIASPSPTN